MNTVQLTGRLTRDPDVRYTDGGSSVARFTLACDRRFKTENGPTADFIRCVAFGKTAEFVEKYFTKGRMAVVSGKLQIRGWTDKDGNKRRTAEVLAENVYFADSKSESGESQANTGGFTPPAYPTPGYAPPAGEFAPLDDEDAQLPF